MMQSPKLVLAIFFLGMTANMTIAGTDMHNWVGLIALLVAARLLQLGKVAELHRTDMMLVLGAAMIAVIPLASPTRIAGGLAGIWLLRGQSDPRVRGAILIISGILLRDPIAKAALDITSETVLALDAALAESFMGLAGMEVVRLGNILTTGSHELLVMSGCSSVTNLSWALLMWVTATCATVPKMQRHHILAGTLVAIAVVLVNGVRLALLGISPAFHAWAHGPDGAMVFETATMLAAMAVVYGSLRYDAKQYAAFGLLSRLTADRRGLERA
jgi:hypothetical protein